MALVFSGAIPPGTSLENLLRAARREALRALEERGEQGQADPNDELRRGVDSLSKMIEIEAEHSAPPGGESTDA